MYTLGASRSEICAEFAYCVDSACDCEDFEIPECRLGINANYLGSVGYLVDLSDVVVTNYAFVLDCRLETEQSSMCSTEIFAPKPNRN